MNFKLMLENRALADIDEAVEYYNSRQKGLGTKFLNDLNNCFTAIKKTPFFQIRYDDVRCVPLKKFPFLIHFSIFNEKKIIKVFAVIHTSLNPKTNWMNDDL